MKPSIPILIFVLFVSLSINSFAEWISEGAIVDQFGVGNSSHHWSGTVHVQTAVDYMLESNPGTQAIFAPINNQVIAANGVHKQGSRVLYPGDIL